MDRKDGKSNGPERRLSTRTPARVSMSGGDDELDLSALVSDGFRPQMMTQGMESAPPAPPRTPTPAQTVPSANGPEPYAVAAPGRRSSISKHHRPQESFSLRHEGGMGPIDEASPSLNRSSSRSTQSTAYVPPADSPYRGPTGPSHPYEMYPQNVRRTMSMTTTSSAAPVSESSYMGPRAPAHPYSMYTQDIATEDAAAPVAVPGPPIPLGWHARHAQYQRQLGAEGEDMGFVGPGGHTEELPPYSQYPDLALERKVRGAGPETVPLGIAIQAVQPAQTSSLPAIPGAGGLGLATRNPEFESRDDLDSPRSRHSSRSFTSDSEHEINLAAEKAGGMSEKEQPVTGWRMRMRKRVCGVVPVWALVLLVTFLIVVASVAGAMYGLFGKRDKDNKVSGYVFDQLFHALLRLLTFTREPSSSSTATMTFDARPIPTPTDLVPLPLGAYSLPIMSISRSHRGCFNDTTQAQAWQCHLVISNLKLTITKTRKDSPGDYTASITVNTSNTMANNFYSYGEQPFLIEKPAPLDLVIDTEEPNRGPAWYHMTRFDKIVIVPENAIKMDSDPEGNRRRIRSFGAKYPIGATDFKRKGMIPDGHKPWICTWQGTFLEVFVYAQQNSSFSGMKLPSPPPPSTPSPTPNPPPPPKPEPTAGPKATAEARVHDNNLHATENQKAPPPTPTPPSPPNAVAAVEQSPTSSSIYGPIDLDFTPPPMPYPRVIKLEERHMYGPAKVRCEQVEIQEEGPAKPVRDADGKPKVIEIIEAERSMDPDATTTDLGRRSTSPLLDRDAGGNDSRNQCSCNWFMM